MPRMRWDDASTFDDLPEEWEDNDFEAYDGPIPPVNTVLKGEIKKVWATVSSSGNNMYKVLFEASGNTGEKAQYNGCPIWDNITWTPKSAFRYGPFLETIGATLRDVKVKTAVAEEDDNIGTPVTKVGTVKFPKSCAVKTKREKSDEYGTQVRVATYMAVAKRAKAASVDEDDDDDDEAF